MDLQLKDKVFIVTGGGAGIGGAITLGLAAEGAIPVIFARSELAEDFRDHLLALSPRSRLIKFELSDDAACAAAVAETLKSYGRIDGLVNNAGLNDGVGLEAGPDAFRASLEKNLTHYYTLAHHCLDALRQTKGAIVNMTRALAVEWAPNGIRVNAVAPTYVRTPFIAGLMADPELVARIEAMTPLHRLADPEEVAHAILFLAGPGASMVTGHTLPVDGGFLAQ